VRAIGRGLLELHGSPEVNRVMQGRGFARAWTRSDVALALTLAVGLLLLTLRLGSPSWDASNNPRYVFDERYTAFTAEVFARGDLDLFAPGARRIDYLAHGADALPLGGRVEWSHPPGAPLAMAASVLVFGYSEKSVRAVSVAAAMIALLGVAALAGRRRACIACAFLLLDPQFFVLARTAMPHALVVACVVASAVAALRGARARGRAAGAWWAACGAAVGLGAAMRWTALPIDFAIVAAALWSVRRARQTWGAAISLVTLAAVAVYLGTFVPYLAAGHSLADLLRLHRSMLWFHLHMPARFVGSSPWYGWPFQISPVTFDARPGADRIAVVLCGGLRLLGWALVPAVVYGAVRARQAVRPTSAVAVAAIVGTWLPWAVLGRFGLAYYLLPAMPFVAVLAAGALTRLRIRALRLVPVGAALLVFAVSYPVLAAIPLPVRLVRAAYGLLF
jgi:4-amino-4-deoxy-L-arabinose transferase-like glycosyltransferase